MTYFHRHLSDAKGSDAISKADNQSPKRVRVRVRVGGQGQGRRLRKLSDWSVG